MAQSSPSLNESDSNFNYAAAGRDTETLANELILLNREVSSLKTQQRKEKIYVKQLEKERNDISKFFHWFPNLFKPFLEIFLNKKYHFS